MSSLLQHWSETAIISEFSIGLKLIIDFPKTDHQMKVEPEENVCESFIKSIDPYTRIPTISADDRKIEKLIQM